MKPLLFFFAFVCKNHASSSMALLSLASIQLLVKICMSQVSTGYRTAKITKYWRKIDVWLGVLAGGRRWRRYEVQIFWQMMACVTKRGPMLCWLVRQ